MRRGFTLAALPRQRVVFGAGSFAELPAELDRLGLGRVALIATASAMPSADSLATDLGSGVVARLDEVRQHVPEALADQSARRVADSGADGLVCVGGGSAIGLGKALAVTLGLPLVAVPTTYSGSEATPLYGVTGTRKRTGRDDRALPCLAMYDPQLTYGLPSRVTSTSGLNAVAHCVEALYAPGANPVTALLAEEGLRLLAGALPRAVAHPSDPDARDDALFGAHLAGASLAAAGSALHHTLCHVLGGSYGLGHADTHAVLLPYVAAYNAPAAPLAFEVVARALGRADPVGGLVDLARNLDVPRSLAEIGMPLDGLESAAAQAAEAVGDRNPRPVDQDALTALLDDAYHGRAPDGLSRPPLHEEGVRT